MKIAIKVALILPALTLLLLSATLILPSRALAHQPKLVSTSVIEVTDPEISKAYYAQLDGQPHIYRISAEQPFDLYVNVLVPDIAGQKRDVSAVIIKDGLAEAPLATLDGPSFDWKAFHEPYGNDDYWMGPEYSAMAEAGEYEIRVWSADNDSKYALAIGEIEDFGGQAGVEALAAIPKLKRDFFQVSPIGFILSPMGWGYILAMYFLGFVFGFAYRAILKRLAKSPVRGQSRNIGKSDRLFRLAIAIGLLLLAITTSWSPILLFFSGFTLFEAIFSWCGLYAALGKNTIL